MTAVLPDRPDVLEASKEELQAARRHALDRSGHTFEQLESQARSGHFESVRARLTWVAIGDLRDLPD